MNSASFTFHLTVGHLRRAIYYGFFIRNRKFLRVATYALGTIFFYFLMCAFGTFPMIAPLMFIAVGYLLWVVFMLVSLERQVLGNVKDPSSFLHKGYEIKISSELLQIAIPESGAKLRVKPSNLYCAIEISKIFLLYYSAEQVYILPKSIMRDGEENFVRNILSDTLNERFYSHTIAKKGRG